MALILFSESEAKPPKLLLISLDGFRWDYLQQAHRIGYHTPNFDSLILNGSTVAPGGVKNSFPTKTFPNHNTLVTGMYPGDHGVVHNNYLDPTYGIFSFKVKGSIWWNNGTAEKDIKTSTIPMPIWIANQLAETNRSSRYARRSGAMMWPGGFERLYNESNFRVWPYDETMANKTKIDKVVQWFTDESEPINFAALYYLEPDSTGHKWGPSSPEVMKLIKDFDGLIGYLIQKLKEHDLFTHMNIIITSDHGMAEITHRVILGDHLDLTTFRRFGSSPVLLIWPNVGRISTI